MLRSRTSFAAKMDFAGIIVWVYNIVESIPIQEINRRGSDGTDRFVQGKLRIPHKLILWKKRIEALAVVCIVCERNMGNYRRACIRGPSSTSDRKSTRLNSSHVALSRMPS